MESHINFSCKGRYHLFGNRENPSQIWFVLHGYGQLASYFARKFSVLEEHGALVIAPEGLSRFYMQDVSSRMQSGDQRVGAAWMTREDRLTDIDNYLSFLNTLYAKEASGFDAPVTVLGFSQGAATATRWVLGGKIRFERLILWAGILPPDIDFSQGKEILRDKETFLVYGTRDPFLNDGRFAEMETLSAKMGITPQRIEFDGEHVIDQKTLLTLL